MTPSAENHFCARILDRRDVSQDLCILRINPGGPLAYRAGQYATLGVDRDGVNGGTPLPGNHRLFCLQGASRAFEFGYREELERYSQEVPWFKYVATVSRPWEDPGWPGERGRVDDLLRMYTDRWELRAETTTAYLCGHPKMIENSRGTLE